MLFKFSQTDFLNKIFTILLYMKLLICIYNSSNKADTEDFPQGEVKSPLYYGIAGTGIEKMKNA